MDTVKMAPLHVQSDPFRTLGIEGSVISGFGGTHAWVYAVNPASPAAKAGLRADDEILELDGKPLTFLRVIFSFRRIVENAVNNGTSFDCTVRSCNEKTAHVLHLRAMAEPKHRWLPLPQSPLNYPDLRNPMPAPTGKFISDATWKDRGTGTPEAAWESLNSALGRGDVERVASLIEVPGSNRQELQALFDSLPDAGRRYYASPERMLAAFVDQETRPRWAQILKVSPLSAATTEIQTKNTYWNEFDHWRSTMTYAFHRTADGWKWTISQRAIKRYTDYYQGVPFELASPEAVPAIVWSFHSS